jgi:hypothetical protein
VRTTRVAAAAVAAVAASATEAATLTPDTPLMPAMLAAPAAPAPAPALRFVFATLADAGSADGGVGRLLAHWFGDGLVQPGSAADEGAGGDVQRVELAGLGHMSLLNHPRVYAVIRGWLVR